MSAPVPAYGDPRATLPDLGPATERRFAEAFADAVMLTRKAAAELIGVDVKTLDALHDAGLVRAVRRGKLRAYTELDLRTYLLEAATVQCSRSTSLDPKPRARPAGGAKVVNFSDMKRRRSKR